MSRSRRNRIQDNRDMFAIWAIFAGDSADELLDQHARYREPATRDLSSSTLAVSGAPSYGLLQLNWR